MPTTVMMSADISVVSSSVVPRLRDCCGVDAGFVDIAAGAESPRWSIDKALQVEKPLRVLILQDIPI